MVAALAEPVAASLSPSKMLAVVINSAPGPCAKLPSGCCRVRSQAMVSASSAGVRLCHWLCNAHPVSSKLAPPSFPVCPGLTRVGAVAAAGNAALGQARVGNRAEQPVQVALADQRLGAGGGIGRQGACQCHHGGAAA